MSETDIVARLKPCPFCGGAAVQYDVEDGENAGLSCIQCTRCEASTALHGDRKENLESSWNDREEPADLSRMREALESVEADLREQAICEQCEVLLEFANRLRAGLTTAQKGEA